LGILLAASGAGLLRSCSCCHRFQDHQFISSEASWSQSIVHMDFGVLDRQKWGPGVTGLNCFFIFIPIYGNDPIWRAYFSHGLKPPTRKMEESFSFKHFFWNFLNLMLWANGIDVFFWTLNPPRTCGQKWSKLVHRIFKFRLNSPATFGEE